MNLFFSIIVGLLLDYFFVLNFLLGGCTLWINVLLVLFLVLGLLFLILVLKCFSRDLGMLTLKVGFKPIVSV